MVEMEGLRTKCIFRALCEIILDDREDEQTLDPTSLKKRVARRHTQFVSYRQQDAHEWLTVLLDTLEEEIGLFARVHVILLWNVLSLVSETRRSYQHSRVVSLCRRNWDCL